MGGAIAPPPARVHVFAAAHTRRRGRRRRRRRDVGRDVAINPHPPPAPAAEVVHTLLFGGEISIRRILGRVRG